MIDIHNLSVFAKNVPLLKDINLVLNPPFRIGIIGSSGSGKSTLAKALCMLLDPELKVEGQIFYEGKNLFDLKEKQKRFLRKSQLKYLVQEPYFALNPYLKIKTQLKEALTKPADEKLLMSYLKKVGLEDSRILTSYPLELSGGQRQRISILQALMQNPAILIADEPTTALDPIKQKEILDLLKNFLSEKNTSMIFVSHDLKTTCAMTDTIYVMHEGQIIETLPSKEFFIKASHPFTQSLIHSLIENHITHLL